MPQRTGVVLASDRSDAQVHPGLPRRVLFVYEVPGRRAPPERIEVTVSRFEWRTGFLDESHQWRLLLGDPRVGRVRLPVTKEPG